MQDFYLIVNWTVAIALAGLGLTTLLNNHSKTLNKVFALFTLTVGVWIISSYTSNDVHNSPHASVIGNYFVFSFSFFSSYLLCWFAVTLAGDKRFAYYLRLLTLPIFAIAALSATPFVVAGAERQGSVYAVEFGPLAILYIVGVVALLASAMVVLHRSFKHTKGDQQAHIRILYRSMVIALPIILLTEFILPAATGWFGLTNIGILPMALPVVALYYSVVRLKLFNLRLVVVRSLAYVLTLGIIGTLYSIVSYYLTTFSKASGDRLLQEVLNVALIIIAINVYPPTVRAFRKLTNSLFYRDAYDPQELFGELNKMLVSSLDVKFLMMQSISIIETALKPDYILIGLRDDELRQRIFSSKKIEFEQGDSAKLRLLLPSVHHKVVVTDSLDGPRQNELQRLLERNNIAVLVRLAQNVRNGEEGFGYLALGVKKSGNPYTSQDIRVLDTVANELIIAIQNALHYEEIQRFNLVLQARVDDATRKLRRTNEKLKTLDETKDDFISMASHQLRTPLTSIKGYLSMVLEGDAGKINETQAKMLGQAFVSSQRMVYLIADLLNVSRLKTGKFVIEAAPTNLAKMVSEEIDQLVETAGGKQIELTYKQPKIFPDVMLDETKTRQVIMNFMDNAIYYTPSGGHIRVELVDAPTSVELRVVDDGIGVPKAEQHHLFTKFYRAGNARKARPDGTGLGLFMAKKVVLAQGGSVIFESKEGKGSTFGFLFPKHHGNGVTRLPVVPEKSATS
jgi:signal transduction histidine kinase